MLLLAVVAAGGVTATIILLGPGRPDPTVDIAPPTQEDIDAQLGMLQQQFQSDLQEKRDLTRVYDQVRLFTLDHPEDQAGQMLFAQIQMQLNQWESAYLAWTRSLELDPNVVEVHKMAGFCAAKRGELEQAVKHYQGAAHVAGTRADNEVYHSLGRLYLALEDADAAEQSFSKALQAPGAGSRTNWKHEAYAGLADVAGTRGDFDQADTHLERAMKLAKLDSGADVVGYHIQQARLLMDRGQADDALAVLLSVAQSNRDAALRIESARLRARLYEQSGDLEKAVNHIATVCQLYQLKANRKDEQLGLFYALLAEWQIKAGRQDAARISIENLKTLLPDHPQLSSLQQTIATTP